MLELISSASRGLTETEWLTSHHSFSFGQYLNHRRIGHSVLQVLNDDLVIPGHGFAEHSHKNMEILSYVVQGVLVHKDNMGNEIRVPAGDFQLMAAGAGVEHSEYNGSEDEELHFLQMWIIPNQIDIRPSYQQCSRTDELGFQRIASHHPQSNVLFLNQEAEIYYFKITSTCDFDVNGHLGYNKAYVHIIKGDVTVADSNNVVSRIDLESGDGLICSDVEKLDFVLYKNEPVEGLLFVLPDY